MTSMPSQAFLQSAIKTQFQIEGGSGQLVPTTLAEVREGIAMSARHTCYAAVFELPPEVTAAQGTYRVRDPHGTSWELFMTPIAPTQVGQHRLEAVFHYELA